MWGSILDILKPPEVIKPADVNEKPDYTLAVVGGIALLVIVVAVILIIKGK